MSGYEFTGITFEPALSTLFRHGLDAVTDLPIQYAACVYDDNENLLTTFNLCGRLPRNLIPSPGALMVTRQSI